MNSTDGTKVLARRHKGRMAAGICAGAADYFGWDVILVRVIVAVVSVITGGTGVLAYLVAWALIPEQGEKSSIAEDLLGKSQQSSTRPSRAWLPTAGPPPGARPVTRFSSELPSGISGTKAG